MRWTLNRLVALLAIIFVFSATYLFGKAYFPNYMVLSILIESFCVSYLFLDALIPKLKAAKIVGNDENKPDKPEIPEMGGFAILAGFSAGSLFAIALYIIAPTGIDLVFLLSAIITIHTIGFIGLADDMLNLPQWFKAILPLFASVPLIAVRAAGSTAMSLPFIGLVDLGWVYILVLIPLAIAVCSNLTNMLAGFNGLEAGMGIVMFLTLSILAWNHGTTIMLVISLAMLGSLLGFFLMNKYPAKIFPGDVGTLTIGVALATSVIIGNSESAGAILVIPYVLDFFIKAMNKFPHTHQDIKDGRLHPKDGKVKGLVHLVMKASNGISEQNLVRFFIGVETLLAIIVLALYMKF